MPGKHNMDTIINMKCLLLHAFYKLILSVLSASHVAKSQRQKTKYYTKAKKNDNWRDNKVIIKNRKQRT
jgi:hypothetical protein